MPSLNIEKQQLHPLNCLIRLVILYRFGPAPVFPFTFPFPSRFPLPAFPVAPDEVLVTGSAYSIAS